MIGLIGWGVLIGAAVAWEIAGQVRRFPTLGRLFGYAVSFRIGRWVLFGWWIWLGWHFFIRGWDFFLRR